MPFCTKCGADVSGVRFCAQCGTPVESAGAGTPAAAGGSSAGAAGQPGAAGQSSTGPGGAAASPGVSDNLAAALAYITPIAIVLLLVEPYKNIRFVRFHCFQSIFFCAAAIVLQIALGITSLILSFVGIGILTALLGPLVSIGIFVLWVLLAVRAYQGQMYPLPVIGDLATKQV